MDVGSHVGQTLEEVINPTYNFDKIVSFEPSKVCYDFLYKKYSSYPNIILNNFGISNKSTLTNLYSTGTDGASVYEDKYDLIDKNKTEIIMLIEASKWIIENTNEDDTIFMKLNCEGSECDIIENLIEKNIYDRISHVMIDFDVRKIPSQQHRQFQILKMLENKKNFKECSQIMIGPTHQLRIRNWLMSCEKFNF